MGAEIFMGGRMSDRINWRDHWPAFAVQMLRRLETGEREYGDESFTRPQSEIVEELAQEALDLAGWAFILWTRIERMK